MFKTRTFGRWATKLHLADTDLCRAVAEMERGLIDADLGGGVVKKRLALQGRGKRGGARTIVATNRGDRWFFLSGFAKNSRETIYSEELKALQEYATDLLATNSVMLVTRISAGELEEICHEG